jgi:thioredoxin 1
LVVNFAATLDYEDGGLSNPWPLFIRHHNLPSVFGLAPRTEYSSVPEYKENLQPSACNTPILETNAVSDQIVHVTDDTFETEVINSGQPVLVDYWAEWCGPCKMIAPILDEIAAEYGDKLKIAKLNIDENPATPPKYGIRGIPTLMLFRNGNVEATKVGALSKSQLAAFLDSNM